MIDEDVLERIEEGSLWVNIIRGDVVSGSRQGTVILQPIEHESNGSTYHFVKICYQGKQKKIAVHRLVWMFVHRRVPPPGFDVHHKRGKGVAFPNGIDNLQLIESAINRSSTQIEEVPF